MASDDPARFTLTPLVNLENQRSRLGDEVKRHLERWLRSAGLQIGDRLPGERELSRQFQVSRPVLREAMRALEQQGLISILPGRGIFVRGDGLSTAVEAVAISLGDHNISLQELVESRALVETHIAAVAAERRNATDLAALERAIGKMEGAGVDKDAFMTAVWEFHIALASATRNRVFAMWMQPMMNHVVRSRKEVVGLQEVRERVVACHREILDAVRRADPKAARAAAGRHIEQFEAHTRLAINMGLLAADPTSAGEHP